MARSLCYSSASPHRALSPHPRSSLPLLPPSASLISPALPFPRLISSRQARDICADLRPRSSVLLQLHGSLPWQSKALSPSFEHHSLSPGGTGGHGAGGGDAGGGDGHGRDDEDDGDGLFSASNQHWRFGLFSSLSDGWRERVLVDPQFPFKILTEEIIGVGASVFGDMSCRPGFGLGELDFIFSNLVVCAIVNFALMYVLAPTASAAAARATLPGVFASCPAGHMWEAGAYSVAQRAGTFVYKGAVFAAVGFSAGLVGTAISTMLLNIRRKLDPSFCLQNPPPPTLLNACTWALQLGTSSNSRYQLLNGLEFGLQGIMNPSLFKGLVFALRSSNNVVGGMSFMMMARLTGSQERPKEMLEIQP